ncbi:hypothetical protein AB0C97_37460 [Streptomyces goshikiensis]|uniref:hypothetical protein n=1 Tax=Streptomyces goshikiensis TaxID=1942 RepID=UPI0033E3E949
MRQIEVRHLYEGAVILDGFRPATVTALENRSPYTVAVRLHSTGDNWTALYSPAAVVLLCVVPAVAWRVHHQQRDRSTGEGKGATHSSSRLSPVHAVRRYWAYGVDHQTVVRLEEEHTVVTSTPITLDQLPGNGQPTPQPTECGDRRFYQLHRRGPRPTPRYGPTSSRCLRFGFPSRPRGRITPLPETVRRVRWTELWARSGKSLDRIVQLRVKAWVESLLKAIETEAMPADSAHRWKSQEQWRAATIRETRRKATDQAHARVTSELRREALAEIEAEGSGFWPVRWEESTKVFLVQGEWTVTVLVSGTDHTAVRSAFASDLPPLIADIVADAQNRIPRPKKTVPISAATDTPAKVRKAWKRDRAKGTAPKAANGAYTPGS